MARKLRLEFPGACYHVINRGNYRADIFGTEGAKEAFEGCLFEACAKSGWRLHAYVLMSNHDHLAVAAWMKVRTQASNGWLCERLHLGAPAAFSRNLTDFRRQLQPREKLWRALASLPAT